MAANEMLHALDHGSQDYQLLKGDVVQQDLYWERHRQVDGHLTILTLLLPERLHLLRNPRSLDAILVHVCINMATIQLHRTALGVLESLQLQPRNAEDIEHSKIRLLPAANNIVTVFRAAGDRVGTAIRNPILSFAAYMAATVFLEDISHAAAEGNAADSRARHSRENLAFLAQVLTFFGQSSALVRANAFQLAADMQRANYDTSMMDVVMNQFVTTGGSASQILVPRSSVLPVFFCPALTMINDTVDSSMLNMSTNSVPGASDTGGLAAFPTQSYEPWPLGVTHAATLSNLQAGPSTGLFSQFQGGHPYPV
jgi:hypothetical protein